MKILALDSTAQVATVALCEDEKLLGEYTVNNGNTHSETLLPMVESLLKLFDMDIKEIDLFAASEGPGSFTGVRIGAATLKGLAFNTQKPCIGVSTLEALAYNLKGFDGILCPVMNARRKQVYTAIFSQSGNTVERLLPDSAIAIAELDELLVSYDRPIYLSGDGYDITLSNLQAVKPLSTPERLRHQSAYSVAQVAYQKYLDGDRTTDAQMAPSYLRPCQAERERAEREKQQSES